MKKWSTKLKKNNYNKVALEKSEKKRNNYDRCN